MPPLDLATLGLGNPLSLGLPLDGSSLGLGRRSEILLFLVCCRGPGHPWVGLGVVKHVPLPDVLAFPDRSLTALGPSSTTALPSET